MRISDWSSDLCSSDLTSKLGTTSTPTIMAVIHKPSRNRSTATSGVMGVFLALERAETAGERADDQTPAVDQHKQHDLERQRDNQWRQHHHAHRHKHTG